MPCHTRRPYTLPLLALWNFACYQRAATDRMPCRRKPYCTWAPPPPHSFYLQHLIRSLNDFTHILSAMGCVSTFRAARTRRLDQFHLSFVLFVLLFFCFRSCRLVFWWQKRDNDLDHKSCSDFLFLFTRPQQHFSGRFCTQHTHTHRCEEMGHTKHFMREFCFSLWTIFFLFFRFLYIYFSISSWPTMMK